MLINCLPRVLGCPVILVTQRLSLIKPQLTAIKRRSALAKTERSCTHGFFRPSPPARSVAAGCRQTNVARCILQRLGRLDKPCPNHGPGRGARREEWRESPA